ncbi:beta-propeller domain-containing protein [Lysinibacillus sp. 54212]|uniref:beta-propeller domain-containing protein n=1 Tax=Lysinibacillus sp. 54212 TaxID=3119829 RepID=UPI002FCC5774
MKGWLDMKGKVYVIGVIIATFTICIGIFYYFERKIEVVATSAVFENQTLYAYVNRTVDPERLKDGSIYIENQQGEKVDAQLSLGKSASSIAISGLPKGDYTLHVKVSAFEKFTNSKEKKTVKFSVIEELEKIASTEDLKNYFSNILNRDPYQFNSREEESSNVMEDSAKSDATGSPSEGETSHSSTNNQVDGIEEGDIAVTDGRYIYSLKENTVYITDAKVPQKMKVVGKIKLEENTYPTKLMVYNDTLIMVYDKYKEKASDKGHSIGTNITTIGFYNIADVENPKLIREVGQEGSVTGVRQYKEVLYLITNTSPRYWMLREEPNMELRPQVYDSKAGAELTSVPLDKIMILPGSSEPNYTIVSAVDLTDFENTELKTETYLGSGSNLYMSKNAIYVTATNYGSFENRASVEMIDIVQPTSGNTDIYKFAIQGTEIAMKAQTTIEGSVLNQFSMDEYYGYLRVATTTGEWGGESVSNNHLLIFDEHLNEVGKLTDLARGERIYSARFMGDKAYIVTFKEVDPLFVIDVEDPKKPTVLGELKIPGFSNYLHPLSENHLIGIGYDTKVRVDEASKQTFVTTEGMKVSLFDVSDLENPKEVDVEIIGGRGTYSDVQHDHKALFRDAAKGYYGFPITLYEEGGEYGQKYLGSGALVYTITKEGITLTGDLITKAKAGEQYEDWENLVQRLLYINDAVYTISPSEIRAFDKDTFKKLGAVKLK